MLKLKTNKTFIKGPRLKLKMKRIKTKVEIPTTNRIRL